MTALLLPHGGMAAILAAAAAACAAVLLTGSDRRAGRSRLRRLSSGRRESPDFSGAAAPLPAGPLNDHRRTPARNRRRPVAGRGVSKTVGPRAQSGTGSSVAAVAVAAIAVAWVVGGWTGAAAGLATAALLSSFLRNLPDRALERRSQQLRADLPLALDLLAASLQSGAPLSVAVEAVAAALPGVLGDRLAGVAVALRLGASVEQAWAELEADNDLRPVARAVVRAADTGSSLSPVVRQLAAEQRDRDRRAAEADARRAGVLIVAPLGLCFLPAFLLIGVVPLVLSLASMALR